MCPPFVKKAKWRNHRSQIYFLWPLFAVSFATINEHFVKVQVTTRKAQTDRQTNMVQAICLYCKQKTDQTGYDVPVQKEKKQHFQQSKVKHECLSLWQEYFPPFSSVSWIEAVWLSLFTRCFITEFVTNQSERKPLKPVAQGNDPQIHVHCDNYGVITSWQIHHTNLNSIKLEEKLHFPSIFFSTTIHYWAFCSKTDHNSQFTECKHFSTTNQKSTRTSSKVRCHKFPLDDTHPMVQTRFWACFSRAIPLMSERVTTLCSGDCCLNCTPQWLVQQEMYKYEEHWEKRVQPHINLTCFQREQRGVDCGHSVLHFVEYKHCHSNTQPIYYNYIKDFFHQQILLRYRAICATMSQIFGSF